MVATAASASKWWWWWVYSSSSVAQRGEEKKYSSFFSPDVQSLKFTTIVRIWLKLKASSKLRWRRRSKLFAHLFMHQSRIEISNNNSTTPSMSVRYFGIIKIEEGRAHAKKSHTNLTHRLLPSSFYNAIWWLRIVCVRLKNNNWKLYS